MSLKVLSNIRYNNEGHYGEEFGRQAWKCAFEGCTSRPSQGCKKCKGALCNNVWHLNTVFSVYITLKCNMYIH